MTVFYTSDLHIGHRSLARLRFDTKFPGGMPGVRPSTDEEIINWHDRMIGANWDVKVRKDDTVWVLGDLSLQGSAAITRALEWVSQRPGIKRLILGNHDGAHPGIERKESGKWFRRYLEVFEEVVTFKRVRINETVVMMSHFPYQGGGDHTLEERFTQWRLPNLGEWLLHGHTHQPEKMNCRSYLGRPDYRQIHVGVDAHNFTPVSQDEVVALMEKYEQARIR